MIVSGLLVCILAAVKMDQFSMTLNSIATWSTDIGVSITPTSSGTYMLVAQVSDEDKSLVAILDSQGVRKKQVIVDGSSHFFMHPVPQTPSGNYLVGWSDGDQFALMELNSTLEVQQELRLSAGSALRVHGVAQRADGEIMAATTALRRRNFQALVIRISPSFVVQEQFHVGLGMNNEPRAVIATQDKGFLVVVEELAWPNP